MKKIRTQSDARGYRELKANTRTTREAMNRRLPPRTAEHTRHAHGLKGIRDIPRVGWQEWEPDVAETLRGLERQRFDKANRYYHAVQRIEALLSAVRRRSEELEQTATQLEETGAYLQSIMNALVDVLVTTDAGGWVSDVNLATELLSGRPRNALVGRPFRELFADRELAQNAIDETMAKGSVSDFELALVTLDGSVVPVSYNGALLKDADGQTVGVVGSARDITELKQAQQTLALQANELRTSNAELEQFAYVASHDLREPLRKIRTFADRLAGSASLPPESRELDYLRRMQDASERMQQLINDLLVFSRITTRAEEFREVALEEVVREVLSDLEILVERNGAQVEVGPMAQLEAEPTQMRQLLQNLISNAVKFHHPDVAPVVRVRCDIRQRVVLKEGGVAADVCRITVQDNGIGFDEKYTDQIFTVFQRLHGRGEYEGTGIGLALCRKIVSHHGGDISVRSRPGEGSVFTVDLPLSQARGDD